MRPTKPPEESDARVVHLPIRDVTPDETRLSTNVASVISLFGPTAADVAPDSTSPPDPTSPPEPDRARPAGDRDDVVLALVHARLGYQAASAAAGRVKLPSLSDFLD